MEIRKTGQSIPRGNAAPGDIETINAMAKTMLTEEQVYIFTLRLCDNDIDRDGECFDSAALEKLGKLFVGKSGIFDHEWSAKEQTARIFRTEICAEAGTRETGEAGRYLKGWAYMLRTEKNRDLIEEIEGGIKKEVSVGCAVGARSCSICGCDDGSCAHKRGEIYDGKLCYFRLSDVRDAYEWSFVAVPAQKKAGVMKQYRKGEKIMQEKMKEFLHRSGSRAMCEELEELEKAAALGEHYLQQLRKEVTRLACLADEDLSGEVFAAIAGKLSEKELLELKRVYEKRTEQRFAAPPQLGNSAAFPATDSGAFLI